MNLSTRYRVIGLTDWLIHPCDRVSFLCACFVVRTELCGSVGAPAPLPEHPQGQWSHGVQHLLPSGLDEVRRQDEPVASCVPQLHRVGVLHPGHRLGPVVWPSGCQICRKNVVNPYPAILICFISLPNHCHWESNMCLNFRICKYFC